MRFIESVGLLGPESMDHIHDAAFATLAPPPERRNEFELLFRTHFYADVMAPFVGGDDDQTEVKNSGGKQETKLSVLLESKSGPQATDAEHLTERNFKSYSDYAFRRFRHMLPDALPTRKSFRTVSALPRRRVDLRQSLREIVRTDGDLPRLAFRVRKNVQRRVLLLIDVSGSMRGLTDDYLKIAYSVVQSAHAAEVFTLGTRLTRITSPLRARVPEIALARAAALVEDWDGGTRLGPTLLALLGVPCFAAFVQGASVLLLSDGLERGDPASWIMAIRRIAGRAHRLSLASPLVGDPRFRPQTTALRGALPYLDDLVDGSSCEAVLNFILSLGRDAPKAEAIWRKVA